MSSFSPLDSQLYGASFSNARVAALFSDEHHVKTMLEVETALARVQAGLGMIPKDAALEIEHAAQSLEVDFAQLRAGISNDGFPVIELVWQLQAKVSSGASDFVHFGATTQDILDTANAIRIRDTLKIIRELLETVIAQLAQLARAHRSTIMAGRTHTQQALPITFGFKVVSWLAPLLRHHERLQELEPRINVVQFGGAVGTLAALGNRGLEMQSALANELDLNVPLMPWHTQRDNIAELAGWLALVTSSLGKIAQDVLLLAQSEIAEVRESRDANRGGSSTMPQKSNPITSELILTIARMNATLLPALHHANLHEHERGTHGMQLEWLSLAQMIGLTSGALEQAVNLSQNMVVNESRMLENVQASHGLMLAEALSFALAQHMSKSEAKKLSADLAREALETKRNLIEIARAKITVPIDWDSLQESNYLGSSNAMIDRVLGAASLIEVERIQRA
jgi:3-carboxy-cis,cis-muconate cycloisomerase